MLPLLVSSNLMRTKVSRRDIVLVCANATVLAASGSCCVPIERRIRLHFALLRFVCSWSPEPLNCSLLVLFLTRVVCSLG